MKPKHDLSLFYSIIYNSNILLLLLLLTVTVHNNLKIAERKIPRQRNPGPLWNKNMIYAVPDWFLRFLLGGGNRWAKVLRGEEVLGRRKGLPVVIIKFWKRLFNCLWKLRVWSWKRFHRGILSCLKLKPLSWACGYFWEK